MSKYRNVKCKVCGCFLQIETIYDVKNLSGFLTDRYQKKCTCGEVNEYTLAELQDKQYN